MNTNNLHDLKNTLHRLELMAELLSKSDFSNFSKEEIQNDLKSDLEKLRLLFEKLSNGQ